MGNGFSLAGGDVYFVKCPVSLVAKFHVLDKEDGKELAFIDQKVFSMRKRN
jgi:hypothetical protein